jgi:hypothetical protein
MGGVGADDRGSHSHRAVSDVTRVLGRGGRKDSLPAGGVDCCRCGDHL